VLNRHESCYCLTSPCKGRSLRSRSWGARR